MSTSGSQFGMLRMPRSRGVVSGLVLLLLGAWGALVPFVGPAAHVAYGSAQSFTWSATRGWLEVLPGAAAATGGILLLISGNRAIAMFGGWLAVTSGAWFVVGRTLAPMLGLGDVGQPLGPSAAARAAVEIATFSGLGTLIVFIGGAVLARVTIRTARDVELAREAATVNVSAEATVAAPKRQRSASRALLRSAPSH